ncbi:MAG: hypothetical protein R2852_01125 [Bacteroidia bacterium]
MLTQLKKDIIYAVLSELDDNSELFEGGVQNKETSLTPELVKNEELKKNLIGIKKGAELNVNIYDLFNENHSIISSSLGISKEAVSDLNPIFNLKVTEIKKRIPAELNQEFFDSVLGKDVATDLDGLKAKVKENLEAYYASESDHQVEHMITHLLEEKHNVPLPNEFLKRWLINTKEEEYNEGNIDERYENESRVLKEVLIREKAAAQYDIKVEKQDIEDASMGYTLSMFRNYGLQNPEFEFVKKFSDDSLKKRDYIEQMNDIAVRRKVYNKVKELVTFNEIKVSIEEFYKLIEEHNQTHNAEH